MIDSDKKAFIAILLGLAELKVGKPFSPEGLSLWWDCMRSWELEDFRAAAKHLSATCEFMPNPYHFEQLKNKINDGAAEAWAKAVHHAASSEYRNGPLGEPMIDICVRGLGGYGAIAMTDEDKLHFLERRFVDNYHDLEDREKVRTQLPQLAGPSRLGPRPVLGLDKLRLVRK